MVEGLRIWPTAWGRRAWGMFMASHFREKAIHRRVVTRDWSPDIHDACWPPSLLMRVAGRVFWFGSDWWSGVDPALERRQGVEQYGRSRAGWQVGIGGDGAWTGESGGY